MLIRKAREHELDACAELYERVAGSLFDWEPAHCRTAEFVRPTFDDEEVHVAMDASRLLGFVSWYRPKNFLHSLFVDPQGCGTGTMLLNLACDFDNSAMTLKCAEPNLSARRFYERHGWTVVERGQTEGVGWLRLQEPA